MQVKVCISYCIEDILYFLLSYSCIHGYTKIRMGNKRQEATLKLQLVKPFKMLGLQEPKPNLT